MVITQIQTELIIGIFNQLEVLQLMEPTVVPAVVNNQIVLE